MSFWSRRNVFITGATGLVGGYLVSALLECGANVTTLLRDRNPHSRFERESLSARCHIAYGDVTSQRLLERVLGENEIDTVFHLAAQTIVTTAQRNPVSTWATNIGGTYALLEACRRSPAVKAVVVASSDKAYGASPILPYDESTPLRAVAPYDVSKAAADMIAVSYAKTWQLPVAITRCGNFYGGGDMNWNRIVPGTIRSLLGQGLRPRHPGASANTSPVDSSLPNELLGSLSQTDLTPTDLLEPEPIVLRSNGQTIRDYFYVEDGALAYLALAEALVVEPNRFRGEAFNFSNDAPISTLDLVKRIVNECSARDPRTVVPRVEIANTATGEIDAQHLSSAKARRELFWQPTFSLEQGIAKTFAWYQDFFGRGKTS